MSIVLLHLSDIHIRSAQDPILTKGNLIAACTFSDLPEASTVFVIASGDIAFSGKDYEYEAAEKLFKNIKNAIQSEKNIPVHFLSAPGNHDCDFTLHTKSRQLILDAIRENPNELDESVITNGAVVQEAYRSFIEKMQSPSETREGDVLWTSHRFTVEEKELIFDTLNVSWCSNLHEEPGTLIFPVERYKHFFNDPADLRILILHHPLNWFGQTIYHPLRKLIRTISNVVISGHEHVGGTGEDNNPSSGHSAYIEGCVLQGKHNLSDSSFNIAVLNLDNKEYRTTRFLWDSRAHYLPVEEGSWADFRSLPKKTHNSFMLEPRFEQALSDPGGVFNVRGTVITLQDLYVYPDVQESQTTEEQGVRNIHSSTIFQDASKLEGSILLSAEEKAGSTSLLYMLFRSYYDQGLLPLYVRGPELKQPSERDIDQLIRRAIVEQYGENSVELFMQQSANKKLLLLDDFDDGQIRSGQTRAKVLLGFSARFNKLLVTVNESFNFNGTIRPHANGNLSDLQEYKLLPFGYSRRAQLVNRWFQRTATDGSLDEGMLLARCDQAERMLDMVMAKNIVPSLPLYLLTLLQGFDSGAQGGFEDSGLGEYYDFLVKAGLEAAGIPKGQWGSIIEYCSHLAWQMHATEHKELSKEELREFNDTYSREQVRVELETRIDALVRARILSRCGDRVRFRYHYIYYFLKGRFLSKKMDDLEVQAYVRSCCAHLYVRENANTILFLAHHAFKDGVFINCVTEAVDEPFKNQKPIEFDGQNTERLKEFVRDLPKLTYTGKSPEKAREEANLRKDDLDDGNDGLAARKEDLDEDAFTAQLITLFKSIEILGQILKNQIASVPRAQRVDLLVKLLKGPLRAVNAYFEVFMQDQVAAQAELAEILAKRRTFSSDEEKQEAARHLLAWLLQSSAAAIILKAIVCVSSDDLLEDIRSAAKEVNSPAARLIATGVKLDSPGRLPIKELQRLMEDLESDFIATRVLQLLTLRRLYMFRTEISDKQWLESKGLIALARQQAVDYTTRKGKLLKGH